LDLDMQPAGETDQIGTSIVPTLLRHSCFCAGLVSG